MTDIDALVERVVKDGLSVATLGTPGQVQLQISHNVARAAIAAGREQGLREAAEVARDGFRCRTCGARFTGTNGHDCERPNWDGLYGGEEIATAIEALLSEKPA